VAVWWRGVGDEMSQPANWSAAALGVRPWVRGTRASRGAGGRHCWLNRKATTRTGPKRCDPWPQPTWLHSTCAWLLAASSWANSSRLSLPRRSGSHSETECGRGQSRNAWCAVANRQAAGAKEALVLELELVGAQRRRDQSGQSLIGAFARQQLQRLQATGIQL